MDIWRIQFLDEINQIRTRSHLNALELNDELNQQCVDNIKEMISKNKIINLHLYQQTLSTYSLLYQHKMNYLINIWLDINSLKLLNPNIKYIGVSFEKNHYHLYYYTYICN